jgi:hypothetical protein
LKKDYLEKLKQWRQSHEEHYAAVLMNPPEHTTLLKALPMPSVNLIMGRKRRGKSALAHAIAEKMHETRGCLAVLHIPMANNKVRKDIQRLLPSWMIVTTDRSQWPSDTVVIYDEASQSAHARRSQSDEALNLDDLIGVSGQRKQMILFISHHSRKLDKNAITDADRILWKEPTYAHVLFERDELHDFTMKAFDFFQSLKTDKEHLRTTLLMDFTTFRFQTFTNDVPSYWNDELSCLFEKIKQTPRADSGAILKAND